MPLGSNVTSWSSRRGGVRTSWPDRVPYRSGPAGQGGEHRRVEEVRRSNPKRTDGRRKIRATASAWSPQVGLIAAATYGQERFVGENRRSDLRILGADEPIQARMSLWASRFENPPATESPETGAPRPLGRLVTQRSRSGPRAIHPRKPSFAPHRRERRFPRMVGTPRKASSSSGTCSERFSPWELHRLVAVPDRGNRSRVAQTPSGRRTSSTGRRSTSRR